MSRNSNLIEIMSPWGREGNHFRNLSDFLNINYGHVFMANDIDDVNIPELIRISERMFRPDRKMSPPRRGSPRRSSPRRSPSRRDITPPRRSPQKYTRRDRSRSPAYSRRDRSRSPAYTRRNR